MSIQFRCNHCSRLVKAPSGLGGKKAKCPKCGSTVEVPLVVSEEKDDLADFDDFCEKESHSPSLPVPPPFSASQSHDQPLPKISVRGNSRSGRRSRAASRVRATRSSILTVFILGLLFIGLALAFAVSKSNYADSNDEIIGLFFMPVVIFFGLIFYLMPTLIAFSREHLNVVPIMVLNIVFGWTLLGWVGCLAWSCSSHVRESRKHIRQVIVHENQYD
jgi:phage FluMu protein Com